jgi:hypothetical protein
VIVFIWKEMVNLYQPAVSISEIIPFFLFSYGVHAGIINHVTSVVVSPLWEEKKGRNGKKTAIIFAFIKNVGIHR